MAVVIEHEVAPELERGSGAFSRAWVRFRRNKIALAAVALIALQLVVAIAAPLIAPYDPYRGDYAATWQLPSGTHPLGTDELGRDVLSRIIYGSRVSLAVGLLSQVVLLLIGVPIGAVAGLVGGWVDYLVMRVIDVLS